MSRRFVAFIVFCLIVLSGYLSASAQEKNAFGPAASGRAGSNPNPNAEAFPAVSERHPGKRLQPTSTAFHPFGPVTLSVDFAVNGAGSNVDTIAFWEAPVITDSLMFIGSKSLSLVEVWRFPYASPSDELSPLVHSCITRGTNGVLVDQEEDLLYVSMVNSRTVCVFSLPSLIYVKALTVPNALGEEPNLALLKLGMDVKRLYVSDEDVVYVMDPASGAFLHTFIPVAGLETMVGDNYEQILYIPDENGRTGVYAYDANGQLITRPDRSKLGDSTIFNSDAEGIFVYTCPSDGLSDDGRGFIVVSDQIVSASTGNDYEFFDRQTWEYLGKLKLTLPDGSYVSNTDGIASTQQNSTNFVGGLFTAIHNDTMTVGLSWQRIVSVTGLNCGELPILTPMPTPVASPTQDLFPTVVQSATPTPATGTTVTLTALEDAYVKMSYPSSNYGGVSSLTASNYSASSVQRAYLKFDLSSLAGKTILGSSLTLTPALDRNVEKQVRLTTSTWSENLLTWNNQPVLGETVGILAMQPVIARTPVIIQLNASGLQSAVGGYLTLAIDNTALPSTFVFNSKESSTGKPTLAIIVTDTTVSPTPIATATSTPIDTATPIASETPTHPPSPTSELASPTASDPDTDTPIPTLTETLTPTPTDTPSLVPSPTWTDTATAVPSETATATLSPTATWTLTPSPVPTQPPADTIPPVVGITFPANGSVVQRGSVVTITADALDESGVKQVWFSVNGSLVCADVEAVYGCDWAVPGKPNITYTLEAVAEDFSGNAWSSSVTVKSSRK